MPWPVCLSWGSAAGLVESGLLASPPLPLSSVPGLGERKQVSALPVGGGWVPSVQPSIWSNFAATVVRLTLGF